MTQILQSKWIAIAMGILLYVATTTAVWKTRNLPIPDFFSSTPVVIHTPSNVWDTRNPELDQLVTELRAAKSAIEKRDKDLSQLETRLQLERQEVAEVMQGVQQMQKEFETEIVRVQAEEAINLKKLAKVYASMETEGAVNILKELSDEQVVKIMVFMKEAETAPILETMAKKGKAEARRVALISERLRVAVHRKTTDKPKS